MTAFGAFILILSGCAFLLSAFFFIIYMLLNRCPKITDRATAVLVKARHKKDVTLYEIKPRGSIRESYHLKNLTKMKYEYSVGKRKYRIRDFHIDSPKQTPQFVWVVYLKKLPWFAYIDSYKSTSDFHYGAYALGLFLLSIMLLMSGISALLYR